MSTRTKEALATIYGDTPTDEASNPGAAARRAELRDLSSRGRKSRVTNQQKEEAMTTQLREKAEAMTLKELRSALPSLGVTGASKMAKADAITAFVKASKPKSNGNGNGNGDGSHQTRVPSPVRWKSDDGEFTGASPSGNWGGSCRWLIKKYFDATGADPEEAKAALKEAKSKLDGGAKSVKVLNVTIKVYDPNA